MAVSRTDLYLLLLIVSHISVTHNRCWQYAMPVRTIAPKSSVQDLGVSLKSRILSMFGILANHRSILEEIDKETEVARPAE